MTLAKKYCPETIEAFIGLEKPKKILQEFAARPHRIAFLFHGRAGSGKSAMARALAIRLGAVLHPITAADCKREIIARLWRELPQSGLQVILVDHADELSRQHQTDLRSKLDGHEGGSNVIWIFTANDIDGLDDGFRTRCLDVSFSTYGAAPAQAVFLKTIWEAENTRAGQAEPNFRRIVKECNGDLRRALMVLGSSIALG